MPSLIRKGQKTADCHSGTTNTARHCDIHTCWMALMINETGGTSQQNSPNQLNAKQSTPNEPGLKNLGTLQFSQLAKQSSEHKPQFEIMLWK